MILFNDFIFSIVYQHGAGICQISYYHIQHDNSMSCSKINFKNVFYKGSKFLSRFFWFQHFRFIAETQYP